MLLAKIILIISLTIQAIFAIVYVVKSYKDLINKDEIKTAIQNKDITKIKAILKSIWGTIKTVKFGALIITIFDFIIVWFTL